MTTVVRGDTACISALHVLKVYAQRLGCDLRSSRLVSRVMASSFLVVSCVSWCGDWCVYAEPHHWSPTPPRAAVQVAGTLSLPSAVQPAVHVCAPAS